MIVVLTGAPGAGKGTQADLLVKQHKYRKVSTGDALRKHVKEETEIGLKAKSFMDQGNLVPDDIMLQIIKQEIGSDSNETIILDGYPRNIEQLKELEKLDTVHDIAGVIHLHVTENDLVERLSGRRVCSSCTATYHMRFNPPKSSGICDECGQDKIIQRSDDHADKIKNRLKVYSSQTEPMIRYFENTDQFQQVDGADEMAAVTSSLAKAIQSFQGVSS